LLASEKQSSQLLKAVIAQRYRTQEIRSKLPKLGKQARVVAVALAHATGNDWDATRVRDDDFVPELFG